MLPCLVKLIKRFNNSLLITHSRLCSIISDKLIVTLQRAVKVLSRFLMYFLYCLLCRQSVVCYTYYERPFCTKLIIIKIVIFTVVHCNITTYWLLNSSREHRRIYADYIFCDYYLTKCIILW